MPITIMLVDEAVFVRKLIRLALKGFVEVFRFSVKWREGALRQLCIPPLRAGIFKA
jgi:hypothetical protein